MRVPASSGLGSSRLAKAKDVPVFHLAELQSLNAYLNGGAEVSDAFKPPEHQEVRLKVGQACFEPRKDPFLERCAQISWEPEVK